MRKYLIITTSLVLATAMQLLAVDAISIDESRPLAQLTVELVQRYGYLVSYEEAPYDDTSLRTEVRSNGLHYRYPSWTPSVFHVPERPAMGTAGSPAPIQVSSTLGPDVLGPLLKEYDKSGNPGLFQVIYDADYAHIVPAARVVHGRSEDFQPILSTHIVFPSETRSCNEALRDLFFRIKTARGVTILGGTTPIGGLMLHQCTVVGSDLTARGVLSQILDQVGTSVVPDGRKNRFSWELLYDVNWDTYFLSTILVPNTSPQPSAIPAQATKKASTPATALPGASRWAVDKK